MRRSRRARTVRFAAFGMAALTLFWAVPIASGSHRTIGFDTARASMLNGLNGTTVDPIITVGDMIHSYRFESIPDGISLLRGGWPGGGAEEDNSRKLTIFVNHETSTVPFPFPADGTAATEANSQNDFDNSQLSRLVLDQQARVVGARMSIVSARNFHRLCSNYLPTAREGFNRPVVFTNEEGVDWVNRSGTQWPAQIGVPTSRQIGVVVAYDVRSNRIHRILGMGRLNHENSVALPGYRRVVMLTTDDTFTTTPSQSQLYSYIALSGDDVLRDRGDLYAFRSTNHFIDQYDDFAPGSTQSIAGEFIKVPRLIATGRHRDGRDIKSSDAKVIALLDAVDGAGNGIYPPPNDGSWQRRPGAPASEAGMDGPQWVLEKWSQLTRVFDFVRLEDVAYDKRRGANNIVYLVDSGRGTAGATGQGISTNGRVWKMVLDKANPRKVTSLSILIEGDDTPVKTLTEIRQPDNIESTRNGLYITEDPGSSQQFNIGEAGAINARVWQFKFSTGALTPVLEVNQSQDEQAGYDVDAAAAGRHGSWEASGIVDVSGFFGPGAFLVDVQAHSLWIQKQLGPDTIAPLGNPDWTYKREGGQLLLVRIPGG